MRAAEGAFAKTGGAVVRRELGSLYDFQRLGLRTLRSSNSTKASGYSIRRTITQWLTR